jgi:hypothetical protein
VRFDADFEQKDGDRHFADFHIAELTVCRKFTLPT